MYEKNRAVKITFTRFNIRLFELTTFPSVLLTCSEWFEVSAICNTLRSAWKAAEIRFGQLFLSGSVGRGYKPVANQQEEDTIGRI
jgi:hypothetical protein